MTPVLKLTISQEENSELPVICKLTEAAFADMQESDHQEHHLVDKLHKSDTYIPELSLVAKRKRRVSRIYFVNESGNRFRK